VEVGLVWTTKYRKAVLVGEAATRVRDLIREICGIHDVMLEFPHIKKHYWGQHMWARGYFCCSTGNVTDEIIAEYIAHQQDDRDDDFKVDG
jgi:putative transposase